MARALVLFSGGLDSTTCLYKALSENEYVEAVSFDYSQKHKIELKKAKKICSKLNIHQTIVKIQTGIFLASSLTDANIRVPKKRKNMEEGIPNTYVPGRNILFLSYAVSMAEGKGLDTIYIGVNSLDYSGYPDCRPQFIRAFQKAIQLETKTGVESSGIQIKTPLLKLSKKDIVLLGKRFGVPFGLTHSCYSPIADKPCGVCDSCILRKKGFEEAGVEDR